MYEPVVGGTQKAQVIPARLAPVGPMLNVMSVDPVLVIAAGKAAPTVACHQCRRSAGATVRVFLSASSGLPASSTVTMLALASQASRRMDLGPMGPADDCAEAPPGRSSEARTHPMT